ncbi:peptidoglycan-binding protein [Aeromicrobium sp. CTD01-1L150]|uniref:peptidoglycan-binding domain-containing protein n=1 Tax=Aeromicrobium sp. CTD01-1L150 TaxID=3341830 RepID=UPI0035C04741
MRRIGIGLMAAVLCCTMATATSQASSSTPVPFPKTIKGLKAPVSVGSALDPVPAYVPQNACQPGTPPGVAKLRALVLKTYGVGGAGNTARTCAEGTSEHSDGRAWDWMVNVKTAKEKAAAADFLAWLTRNDGRAARRLGIMYVIYNKKIWASYRAKDGWRASSGHTDHVHISFSWNGARGNTSWWTGTVRPVDHGPCQRFAGQPSAVDTKKVNTKPCPGVSPLMKTTNLPTLEYGHKHSAVSTAQGLLGLARTGTFDTQLRARLISWQRANNLPKTGGLDQPTWAILRTTSVTKNVAKEYTPASARTYGAKNYSTRSMRSLDTGRHVLVLQRALGLPLKRVTGYFGVQTTDAVKAMQRQLNRPVTGTWTGGDWKALNAAS